MICDKAQGRIFVYLNRNLQSHSNCRQTHTQPLPSPTVTCRVANIFPRSNLTRNSNEIKCHQCGFSLFLLIVLGNGIRATDDQGLGAVKPLPLLSGGPGWYRRYLTQGLQFKHQSAIMFSHVSLSRKLTPIYTDLRALQFYCTPTVLLFLHAAEFYSTFSCVNS